MTRWRLIQADKGIVLRWVNSSNANVAEPLFFHSAFQAACFMIDHALSPREYYWEETP